MSVLDFCEFVSKESQKDDFFYKHKKLEVYTKMLDDKKMMTLFSTNFIASCSLIAGFYPFCNKNMYNHIRFYLKNLDNYNNKIWYENFSILNTILSLEVLNKSNVDIERFYSESITKKSEGGARHIKKCEIVIEKCNKSHKIADYINKFGANVFFNFKYPMSEIRFVFDFIEENPTFNLNNAFNTDATLWLGLLNYFVSNNVPVENFKFITKYSQEWAFEHAKIDKGCIASFFEKNPKMFTCFNEENYTVVMECVLFFVKNKNSPRFNNADLSFFQKKEKYPLADKKMTIIKLLWAKNKNNNMDNTNFSEYMNYLLKWDIASSSSILFFDFLSKLYVKSVEDNKMELIKNINNFTFIKKIEQMEMIQKLYFNGFGKNVKPMLLKAEKFKKIDMKSFIDEAIRVKREINLFELNTETLNVYFTTEFKKYRDDLATLLNKKIKGQRLKYIAKYLSFNSGNLNVHDLECNMSFPRIKIVVDWCGAGYASKTLFEKSVFKKGRGITNSKIENIKKQQIEKEYKSFKNKAELILKREKMMLI